MGGPFDTALIRDLCVDGWVRGRGQRCNNETSGHFSAYCHFKCYITSLWDFVSVCVYLPVTLTLYFIFF